MTQFGDDVAGLALALLQSLWAELGIEGSPRHHDTYALDLEPLIVFTACCGDARLRARAIDWCVLNRRFLSISRLNHFSRRFGGPARRAYEGFAAAARVNSAGLAANRPPLSVVPDLRRPSLLQLRLRALTGVSARAEVLRLLLAKPDEPMSAMALVEPAGCGKAGVAEALDLLTLAGVTIAQAEGGRTVYALTRPAEVAEAVSGVPATFPDWGATLRILEAIVRYGRADAGARVKAAGPAVRSIQEDCGRIPGLQQPPPVADEVSALAFERWARAFIDAHVSAPSARAHMREIVYTVHRLLLGGWIVTVTQEGFEPRPLALSDDPELQGDRRARRRLKPDDVGAGAEVIESIFVDIRTRELHRREGSLVPRRATFDSQVPALSREFAAELLQPIGKGQAMTFTEEFLQRWSTSHRHQSATA